MRSFTRVAFLCFLLLLLTTSEATVKKPQPRPARPAQKKPSPSTPANKAGKTPNKPSAGAGACDGKRLAELARAVNKLNIAGVQFVRIERDIEVNSKRQCKKIVTVGVFKGWTAATKLAQISADLAAVSNAIKQGLSKAGLSNPDPMTDIEILRTTKFKRSMATGNLVSVLLESHAARSTAKRLGKSGLSSYGRLAAAAAPPGAEPGQWTSSCHESLANGDCGTLGGFLRTRNNRYLALTNQHVYQSVGERTRLGRALCNGHAIYGVSATNNAMGGIPLADQLEFSGQDEAAGLKLYGTLAQDLSMDAATILVKQGVQVSCKINGKSIAGVRADTTFRQFRESLFDDDWSGPQWQVWKYGGSTGLTTGQIFAAQDRADNPLQNTLESQGWGWWVHGLGPDMPDREQLRDPRHPWVDCADCFRPPTNNGRVRSREEALQAQPNGHGAAWDTRMFSAEGDSGSLVLDNQNQVVCLHALGGWVQHGDVFRKESQCIPFAEVLRVINLHVGNEFKPVTICTTDPV